MRIARTDSGTVHVTLTAGEAASVRDDLGGIWANKVSTAGDQLHSLLESVTDQGQADEDVPKSPEDWEAECRRAVAEADIAAHPSRL